MPIFVALLRGINVGKAKRLPMEALRQLLAELGYAGVKTLLNSGNAVFHAAGTSGATHAESIGQAISETLALEVPVIVKSAHQFDAIVREYPFGPVDSDHSRHIVAFTQEKHSLSTLRSIEALVNPPELFVVGKRAALSALCERNPGEQGRRSTSWQARQGGHHAQLGHHPEVARAGHPQ
ncbi:MAG: DUF1697 domain-containing protein [Betaproteobacteria bacterium]|nr:DUF1697 domain-containing protein [Betaproteobacteria bacterium]